MCAGRDLAPIRDAGNFPQCREEGLAYMEMGKRMYVNVAYQIAVHFFEWIFGQIGSINLVDQHLVVTCYLLLDSIQCFLQSCPKSWVFLVELY